MKFDCYNENLHNYRVKRNLLQRNRYFRKFCTVALMNTNVVHHLKRLHIFLQRLRKQVHLAGGRRVSHHRVRGELLQRKETA